MNISIFTLFLMFINLFLAIPMIIYNFYRKKSSYLLTGLFFAGLGFFFIPEKDTYDLARYFQIFEKKEIIETFIYNQKDLYARYVIFFLRKYELSKHILPALSAFLSYYYLFKSLGIVLKVKKNKNKLYYNMVLLLNIPIIWYTGIRILPAISIFIYGLVLSYIKKEKASILYMILASMIHISMLGPLIIHSIAYILTFNNLISYKNLKKISILSFFLGIIFLNSIFDIINFINQKIEIIPKVYLEGKWGQSYYTQRTFLKMIPTYIFLLLKQGIMILNVFIFQYRKEKQCIMLLTSLCFLTVSFFDIYNRNYYLVLFFSIIVNIKKKNQKNSKLNKVFYFGVILYGSLILIRDIMIYKESLYLSYRNLEKISIFNILMRVLSGGNN